MGASYKKLWKLLIDRDMKKQDLSKKAGVSATSIAKLGKGENVNTDILIKICRALGCEINDIMEILPDEYDDSRS
ncbi:MAG: helix-turn-helix transcriptional regulator [Oscillospiraceae bacterium]|nr:helix-turn-helix transcriptional regulator [Oscillospiraceae bacterium]